MAHSAKKPVGGTKAKSLNHKQNKQHHKPRNKEDLQSVMRTAHSVKVKILDLQKRSDQPAECVLQAKTD